MKQKKSKEKNKSTTSSPAKAVVSSNTKPKNNSLPQIYHPKKGILFPPSKNEDFNEDTENKINAKWYDECKDNDLRNETAPSKQNQETINHYRKIAQDIYSTELKLYQDKKRKRNTTNEDWIESTMKKGTLKDRIAAMSITASDNPIHKGISILDDFLDIFNDSLKGEGGTTQSRMISMSIEALVELFIQVLLPNDRKLQPFDNRPLSPSTPPKVLFLWIFEEKLKEKYTSFLNILFQQITNKYGVLENDKIKIIEFLALLLKSVPENEEFILSTMVNKLGDPNRKIVRKVMNVIRDDLLEEHPVMANTIVLEVEQFMKRANINQKCVYNAVLFLNMIAGKYTAILSSDADNDLSGTLYDVYFSLFESKVLNSSSGTINSPLLSAILSGVNQVHQNSAKRTSSGKMEQHLNTFYKIVHQSSSPMASIQALLLLEHYTLSNRNTTDNTTLLPQVNRFYRVLYSKIYDLSRHTSKPTQYFFHALYKAMKYDTNRDRFIAFIKRLYQMTCMDSINPSISCATSFLISQLSCTLHKSLFHQRLIKHPKYTPNVTLEDILIPKRDPDSKDYLWEVTLLQYHYHPSCSKFVRNTMNTASTTYSGNPLVDFSLMHFLDKFAYKQPKKKTEKKKTNGISFSSKDRAHSILVNEDTFASKPEHAIQEQDLFFYKYFTDKKKGKKQNDTAKPEQKHKYDSDDDDDDTIIDNLNIQNDDDDDEEYDSDDPEEEAFATKLAEQLMQNNAKGKSIQDLDDEDPNDLDDWSYDSDEDDDDGSFPDVSDDDIEEEEEDVKNTKDEGKKKTRESLYADADDYEDIVNNHKKKHKKQK